ncbi:glycosyltransferase [Patescibacteria group bacterium]|nr:glycosyltransferase [Patescibacteria group bacterium]
MTKIVITGSHLTPALALTEQLPTNWRAYELGEDDSPRFRRYDWWGSALGLFKLPGLVWKTTSKLQLIKPAVVVSFGGYSAVPVCLAAWWLKLPLLIHEQTFGVGLATKITSRLASQVAISWQSSRGYFSAKKTVLTGNPVRKAILNLTRSPRPVILITGGHQGSLVINQAIGPILHRLLKRFTVYHQYGLSQPEELTHPRYHAQRWFNTQELARIYSKARLVVGRAGINTVTELAYLKLPAVLIPLPYTQRGEQLRNALYLKSLGLAVILPQAKLTPGNLHQAIIRANSKLPRNPKVNFPARRVATAAQSLYQLVAKLRRDV